MTKRSYSILQKKLQELESQLTEAFSLPPDSPYSPFYYREIDQKFLFLNTLLSAEIASSPKKPSYNLHHIAERVAELEAAFREWDGDNNSAVKASTVVDDHVETGSTCSCHDNDRVDDADADAQADGSHETGSHGSDEETAAAAADDAEKRSVVVGRYVVVMVSGVVIGMALMGLVMVKFSDCFHYVNQNTSLPVPT